MTTMSRALLTFWLVALSFPLGMSALEPCGRSLRPAPQSCCGTACTCAAGPGCLCSAERPPVAPERLPSLPSTAALESARDPHGTLQSSVPPAVADHAASPEPRDLARHPDGDPPPEGPRPADVVLLL